MNTVVLRAHKPSSLTVKEMYFKQAVPGVRGGRVHFTLLA